MFPCSKLENLPNGIVVPIILSGILSVSLIDGQSLPDCQMQMLAALYLQELFNKMFKGFARTMYLQELFTGFVCLFLSTFASFLFFQQVFLSYKTC